MKILNLEQIQKIVHGVSRVEEGDGLISFFRFTKKQEELYKTVSTDFYNKTFATAGVTLEFETDSENLSLSVVLSPASSRTFFTHSIFANDKRVGELSGDIGEQTNVPFEKTFVLGGGTKRIKIQFPWSVASKLVHLKLDDSAFISPVEKNCNFLMLGDSITQGYDASVPEKAYAIQLVNHFNANALNKGIAGEQFFAALTSEKEDFEPDLITVAYGTNDWRHSTKERFDTQCKAFFKNLRNAYPNVKIIAITPIWRVDIDNEQEFGQPLSYVTEFIKSVALDIPNMVVIDASDFIPHDAIHFQTDGVHPLDSGFKHYGQKLLEKISTIIS